jgi:hypothetical protein
MSRYLRMRVENCVATILELNRYLGDGQIRPEILYQFKRLKDFLQNISEETADEIDIGKIEEATSLLLEEISDNLKKYGIDYRHQGSTN